MTPRDLRKPETSRNSNRKKILAFEMNCELELGLDSQELKKISLSLSDKMLHAKETTKMINQVASANSQPSFQPQPALQASNKQNSTVVSLLITAHRNHLNITNQTSTRNKCTKGGQRNQ